MARMAILLMSAIQSAHEFLPDDPDFGGDWCAGFERSDGLGPVPTARRGGSIEVEGGPVTQKSRADRSP